MLLDKAPQMTLMSSPVVFLGLTDPTGSVQEVERTLVNWNCDKNQDEDKRKDAWDIWRSLN